MSTHSAIERLLRNTGSNDLGRIVADLADIAVVVSSDGIVRDVPLIHHAAEPLDPAQWRGQRFSETIDPASNRTAVDVNATLRLGRPIAGLDILHAGPNEISIGFRYGGATLQGGSDVLLLGRTVPVGVVRGEVDFGRLFTVGAGGAASAQQADLTDILRLGADLVILVDQRGRMLWANDAFHAVVQTSLVTDIGGRFLEDLVTWRDPIDFDALTARAVETGATLPVAATLRSDSGGTIPVTVGVTRLPKASSTVYGVVIRAMGASDITAPGEAGAPAVAALYEQNGQVPLKGLVRETADVVERQCIHAALQLSGNNRSAAARTLGISRQALYQKLERFGLLDD